MRYSRTGIIAVLLAAEVFIGGAIVWAVTGGRGGWGSQITAQNNMAEQTRIDAGQNPHVVIADANNRIDITASTDGKVHVTDHTHRVGWFLGPHYDAPLSVQRTADGVAIRRGDGQPHSDVAFFGIDFERTDVAVPQGAAIDIQRCDGATISGVQARDVRIDCGDGSLHFDDLQAPSIDAVTADGSIRASDLHVQSGRLQSGDGSIRVGLSDGNLNVRAHTGDGSIRIDGRRVEPDESGAVQYQIGTGGGSLQVSTQDGSIHISTNGAL